MSYLFWGTAAAVFTLLMIRFGYSEGVIGCTYGNKDGRWIEKWGGWAIILMLGVAEGSVLAWIGNVVYGHEPLCVLKQLFAYIWLLPVAEIDKKTRRIPNHWVLYGLIGGLLFLMAEIFAGRTGWIGIRSGAVGATLGGGFFLAAAMVSGGGIGMGDVKMYVVLGLLIGGERVFTLILITLILALVHGLCLILHKKASRKTMIPLGPFACAAMMIFMLINK